MGDTGDFPRTHQNTNASRSQKKMMAEKGTSPSECEGRVMFMSMFNDIEWWRNQNELKCVQSALRSQFLCSRIRARSLECGDNEKWCGTSDSKSQ